MTKTFSKGGKVAWNTSQGETRGAVERTLTKPTDINRHHVAASKGNPEYLVKSDKSGDVAGHRPEALKSR
jgi:hypothetical protein